MNVYRITTSFIEVPGELSVILSITGCPMRCKNCHSKELWDSNNGQEITKFEFNELLKKYKGIATCITFFGGEWHKEEFLEFLRMAVLSGFKTCLFTGLTNVPNTIKELLTYLKTGPYIESLGGLESENTNQKLVNLKTNTDITHQFRRII
jgi:anaerobic ribonucleoside-triphosphate reductase activating protein